MAKLNSLTFNSSGTWVAPAGVTQAMIFGMGAGGGGGGGGGGGTGTPGLPGTGGGGGGGAIHKFITVNVAPGTSYAVTIGTGGGGGSGGGGNASGAPGGDANDTTFDGLLTFRGAQRGSGGMPATVAPTDNGHTGNTAKLVSFGLGIGAHENVGAGAFGPSRGASATQLVGAHGGTTPASTGGGYGGAGFDDQAQGGGGGGGGGASTWPGGTGGTGEPGGPGFAINGGGGSSGPGIGAGGGGGGGGGGTVSPNTLRGGTGGQTGGNGILVIMWVE